MAIARRGSQSASSFTSSAVTSLSVSLPVGVVNGDFIVVTAGNDGSGGKHIPAQGEVTDNQGNSYTRDATGSDVETTSLNRVSLFSCLSIHTDPALSHTITYRPGSSRFLELIVREYDPGASRIVVVTTAAGGSDTAGTTYTTGTTSDPGKVDALAVAGLVNSTSANQAILTSSPFTEVASDGNGATDITGAMSDRLITATGTQQCSWTSQSAKWESCIVVYAAAPITNFRGRSRRERRFMPTTFDYRSQWDFVRLFTSNIGAGGGSPDVSVNLTGIASTVSAGSFGVKNDVPITGNASTVSAGSFSPSFSVSLSGIASTVSAGSFSPTNSVSITGVASTVSRGSFTPATSVPLAGEASIAAPGTFSTTGGDPVGGASTFIFYGIPGIATTKTTPANQEID